VIIVTLYTTTVLKFITFSCSNNLIYRSLLKSTGDDKIPHLNVYTVFLKITRYMSDISFCLMDFEMSIIVDPRKDPCLYHHFHQRHNNNIFENINSCTRKGTTSVLINSFSSILYKIEN